MGRWRRSFCWPPPSPGAPARGGSVAGRTEPVGPAAAAPHWGWAWGSGVLARWAVPGPRTRRRASSSSPTIADPEALLRRTLLFYFGLAVGVPMVDQPSGSGRIASQPDRGGGFGGVFLFLWPFDSTPVIVGLAVSPRWHSRPRARGRPPAPAVHAVAPRPRAAGAARCVDRANRRRESPGMDPTRRLTSPVRLDQLVRCAILRGNRCPGSCS